jgi:hypothetical protein
MSIRSKMVLTCDATGCREEQEVSYYDGDGGIDLPPFWSRLERCYPAIDPGLAMIVSGCGPSHETFWEHRCPKHPFIVARNIHLW